MSFSSPDHIHSFTVRHRRGGMSSHQHQVWHRWWSSRGVDLFSPSRLCQPVSPDDQINAWCASEKKLILDIGCGSGDATVAMAGQELDCLIIAVEVYQHGIVQLLNKIEQTHRENIRIIYGDAYVVLSQYLPHESLSGIRLFFPDPWPKKRHHKRRFLQPHTVGLMIEKLKPYGIFHVATDHAEYANHIRQVCAAQPQLHPVTLASDLLISVARPVTKYEAKGRSAGRVITDMIWEKRS